METRSQKETEDTAARIKLSIVVPTYNERPNVGRVVDALDASLAGISWEVIFVDDDSPDETAEAVRSLARRDGRVRCLQRIGRRGLSSAVIEGALASAAPYIAVIDGDLQHDERLLPKMLSHLEKGEHDIVIGSRYAPGGGLGDWEKSRVSVSRWATRLSRTVVRADLSDPMSGFFMIARRAFAARVRNLSGLGFKILLDLFASAPGGLRFIEIPYQFRARSAGESKLDSQVVWEYAMLLGDKLFGRFVPVRFLAFLFVGGLGVLVHMALLALLYGAAGVGFVTSQAAATFGAMTFNFALNNALTYRDKRLRGRKWLLGWIAFCAACSVGALANVGIAFCLFQMDTQWLLAGLAGVAVGAVWNFAVSQTYIWNRPGKTRSG